MHGHAKGIVETVRGSSLVVLQGEPGSGKTTQVPQFLLDDMIAQGRGGEACIICTQPRRVSAMAVAKRVAHERGETCKARHSLTCASHPPTFKCPRRPCW